MSTSVSTHTSALRGDRHRANRYVFALVAGAVLIIGGLSLAGADVELGLAICGVGFAAGAWGAVSLEEHLTLSRLDGLPLASMAVPLPVLPTVSARPVQDLAWLPAGVPAIVALPDGGWGLIAPDTAEGAIHRDGFNGRWYSVAEPAQLFDPMTNTPDILKIPRDSSAVLVDDWPTPLGVTGSTLRARAEREGAR